MDTTLQQTEQVQSMVKLGIAQRALAEARTLDDVKRVRDQAEALRLYVKQQEMGLQMQNDMAEIKLRAERRAGEILATMEKQDGGDAMRARSQGVTEVPPTLAELGIEKMQSHRWQLAAQVPEDVFERHVAEVKANGGELTSAGVVRLAKRMQDKGEAPDLPDDKYRVLYADPPWKYSDKLTEDYGPAEHHYPTLTIGELCLLPIAEMTADDAVLFMWATSPLLEDAFKVIRAWGFEYKTSFVWDKVKHNFGHYNSVRHELLLVCTKGSCTPDNPTLIDSVQTIERSDNHSEKPEQFRTIIDTLYPHGNRIELFARKATQGWDVWGNEVSCS